MDDASPSSSMSPPMDVCGGLDDDAATNNADFVTEALRADGGENAAASVRCRAIVMTCLVDMISLVSGFGNERAANCVGA